MIVTLESVINPDHNFEYNRAIPKQSVEVSSLEEAQKVCRDFIIETDIGGGNWSGGEVWEDGVMIAYISYNCRVWTAETDRQQRRVILEN